MNIRTFRLVTTNMQNEMPVAIAPHSAPKVHMDNPYLPLGTYPIGNSNYANVDNYNWRNGVPVIPATTLKAVIRHLLAVDFISDSENVPIDTYNMMAIGGVFEKNGKEKEIQQSPNQVEKQKELYPLIGLFGGGAPIFMKADIRQFSDAVPNSQFRLEKIPHMRANTMTRDHAAMPYLDKDSIDEKMLKEAESSNNKKLLTKQINDIGKEIKKLASDDPIRQEKEAEIKILRETISENKKSGETVVQTGQLHEKLSIPANQSFTQSIVLDTNMERFSLLIAGLRGWGIAGGYAGSMLCGCGAGITFDYEIEEFTGSPLTGEWNPVGRIAVTSENNKRTSILDGVAQEAYDFFKENIKDMRYKKAA